MKTRGYNPIIQTKFTADPAPVVFTDPRYSDRLFVYTSHDAPGSDWFTMDNLLCYSTTDLVNWTDHGAVMNSADFAWAKKNTFWASQVIDRNGKFYAYVPIERGQHGPQIGVGISDSPYGPFTDAIGQPLITANWDGDIDPTVYIDDDGQAYMYWGNPRLKYAKLKENMIELDGPVVHVPMTVESFGERVGGPSKDGKYPTAYEEGPWLIKRDIPNNPYYLFFAGGQLPEHIGYSTAPTAEGPWTYGGIIMPAQQGTAFTIHPGITDYKGRSYYFYHCQRLKELEGFTGGFTRSVSVAEFSYNPDGSVSEIPFSSEGPEAIATLDPYQRNEAETINRAEGVKTQRNNPVDRNDFQMHVCDIRNGAYIKVGNVDFGETGAKSFMACIACGDENSDAVIELRLDSQDGTLIGTLPAAYTGGWDAWQEKTASINGAADIHDLYFVFKGSSEGELLRFDYWQFS